MDAYECSTAEASKRLHQNPAGRWTSGELGQSPAEGTAWARITNGDMFTPALASSLQISREDRVFALGSCFARGIETALQRLGFAVASRTTRFDALPLRGSGWAHDYTNRYNPWSIANELRWSLDPEVEFPAEALQQLPDGRWFDPHSTPILEFASREETLLRRKVLNEIFSEVAGCRLVVITLGLVETFFDTYTRLFTNGAPWLSIEPERFRFRVLTFAETMAGLEDVHLLLTTFGHCDVQIVVTTSPVPLGATFTGQDVVIANTHSKAVMRTAAGEWAACHDNVHYFPSYEITMNSTRGAAWHPDGRHVRRELVDHIMQTFIMNNLEPNLQPATERQSLPG